jgi:hypothetical protein
VTTHSHCTPLQMAAPPPETPVEVFKEQISRMTGVAVQQQKLLVKVRSALALLPWGV